MTLLITPRTMQIQTAMRWQRAMLDPIWFLRDFVYTVDTHHQPAIRPFPSEAPHIPILTRLWQYRKPPLMSVRKSRQMFITWWGAAISLWDALHPGKLIMLQSKRLEDAVGDESTGDGPLGRAKAILSLIPRGVGLIEGTHYQKTSARIVFPGLRSAVWAVPQGADIMRQRTASGIWSDESHFQDEFSASYTGAAPCLRGGGWFLSTSTANPGAALDLHEDRLTQ